MSDKNHQATTEDILEAVNNFAGATEEKFEDVLKAVNNFAGATEERFAEIKSTMVTKDTLKSELAKVKEELVTKDYLDTKLFDLRGDLVVMTRKEDAKVKTIVKRLREKNIFDDEDVRKIMGMEPFAQPSL